MTLDFSGIRKEMYILIIPPDYTCTYYFIPGCLDSLPKGKQPLCNTSSPISISALFLPLCFSALQHLVFLLRPRNRADKLLLIKIAGDTGWIKTVAVSWSL